MQAYFNIDAMLYFCKDILPLIKEEIPDVKLYIVGYSPRDEIRKLLENENIIITGSVPDVLPYIKKTEVYIAPLRIGTGIKTKIIEALACAKPIVTTSIGIQGLQVENGKNIIVADGPKDFAQKTIRLLKDSNMRKELSKNARELFEKNYKLSSVKNKIQKVYSDVISEEKLASK